MISIKEYNDGISFINAIDNEIAFYSFITDRVTFREYIDPVREEYGSISITFSDLKFISNIIKIYKIRIKNDDKGKTDME